MRVRMWDTQAGTGQQSLTNRRRVTGPGILALIGWTAALAPFASLPVRAQERPGKTVAEAGSAHVALTDLQDAFSGIANQMEPAVVTVFSTKTLGSDATGDGAHDVLPFGGHMPRRSTGTGSGFIIRSDGWILTNDHVVGGADRVTVKLHDGREFPGTVRRDARSDLALVKIDAPTSLPTARMGDSDKLKIGHWAIAIGSPYKYEGSFSVGVISSLYRRQEIMDMSAPGRGRLYPDMIQTDAAINPGNSGGPLCNIDGEVIGINTAIESENGGSIGIGFAIPINAAKFVVDQLLDKGRVSYGFLGVSPTSVTPRLAAALKVDNGALVDMEPLADSPAGKAGLHAGDVVTAIDGKPVHNELDLRTLVAHTAPNSTIDMTVVRDGKTETLKATVTEWKDEAAPDKPRVPGKTRLGIEVQALTDKVAERAGVPATTPGVVVKSIDPDSSAADVDELAPDSVILRVNGTPTPTIQAFQAATTNLKAGEQVKILFQNGPTKRFAVVGVD